MQRTVKFSYSSSSLANALGDNIQPSREEHFVLPLTNPNTNPTDYPGANLYPGERNFSRPQSGGGGHVPAQSHPTSQMQRLPQQQAPFAQYQPPPSSFNPPPPPNAYTNAPPAQQWNNSQSFPHLQSTRQSRLPVYQQLQNTHGNKNMSHATRATAPASASHPSRLPVAVKTTASYQSTTHQHALCQPRIPAGFNPPPPNAYNNNAPPAQWDNSHSFSHLQYTPHGALQAAQLQNARSLPDQSANTMNKNIPDSTRATVPVSASYPSLSTTTLQMSMQPVAASQLQRSHSQSSTSNHPSRLPVATATYSAKPKGPTSFNGGLEGFQFTYPAPPALVPSNAPPRQFAAPRGASAPAGRPAPAQRAQRLPAKQPKTTANRRPPPGPTPLQRSTSGPGRGLQTASSMASHPSVQPLAVSQLQRSHSQSSTSNQTSRLPVAKPAASHPSQSTGPTNCKGGLQGYQFTFSAPHAPHTSNASVQAPRQFKFVAPHGASAPAARPATVQRVKSVPAKEPKKTASRRPPPGPSPLSRSTSNQGSRGANPYPQVVTKPSQQLPGSGTKPLVPKRKYEEREEKVEAMERLLKKAKVQMDMISEAPKVLETQTRYLDTIEEVGEEPTFIYENETVLSSPAMTSISQQTQITTQTVVQASNGTMRDKASPASSSGETAHENDEVQDRENASKDDERTTLPAVNDQQDEHKEVDAKVAEEEFDELFDEVINPEALAS